MFLGMKSYITVWTWVEIELPSTFSDGKRESEKADQLYFRLPKKKKAGCLGYI
ncbi:uncharacterized protein LY89DRAFT_225614 [Mollisia scopiformis]|uniref:Uncharacterized protein n=1 Tax=Mollisia scopiformis TaxID=149040 RepID=A0A194WTZ9_MOLSC|nr:uncharacterized protein LY89DRAFT_225614 [Mollisia scopiformis]KUJ11433.1 hypothetical protein LY89DRAFT_225614 [Mollisia scopiformis]